ncbi:hypothetical protein NEOLEDRAFT_1089664 [Neolentinus lepideus HHB14362 ss-1]|uniref:Uncharacterized protein n=1 Tax=Neolentinus lepideus HHB14362 ss-1 TaxID=1314782 RepID=A0A165TNI1_9AGAM|nr:hypothetical protein NEOLEDRAFT_1089664 [Neolentinus lepideus HHB14362 ss-1]
MATTPAPNPRASLLSGLRTGGVRSSSNPVQNMPHTAAPGGSFNIPRFNAAVYPPDEDEDELSDMVAQNLYINPGNYINRRQQPLTAAVDTPNNHFAQQQGHMQMNNTGFQMTATGFGVQDMQARAQAQAQAIQMQMVQMEIIRLQALQAQQYQVELIAQAQRQQQAQNGRRASAGFNPPATAAPTSTSFDLRSAALNAQMRRATQADQMKSHAGVGGDDQVPMTAALGGKFGGRMASLSAPRYSDEQEPSYNVPPATPGRTTVISGGTSLGSLTSNNLNNESAAAPAPSKSDAVSSWRRGGNNNSVLSGNRVASLPNVKVSPPPSERASPPPNQAAQTKARPQPLRFSLAVQQSLPAVQIDTTEGTEGEDDTSSTTSSRSGGAGSPQSSSPFTPPHSSPSSNGSNPPLSPREEASKKLYEGLGVGRPGPQGPTPQTAVSHRMASQPVRQPRGPPSGADELGPKNFATRIRRKAIGGLEMLMGARERREVEVF